MWMQIDEDKAEALLAITSDDPTIEYFKERVRQYEDQGDELDAKYLAAAKEHVTEGELEVDDNACVSISGDNGAYVQCWLWISDEEAGIEEEEEETSE